MGKSFDWAAVARAAILALALLCSSGQSMAAAAPGSLPPTGRLYQALRQKFRSYYPEVTSHTLDHRIHFEYGTRVFIVHHPLKTGEWQDPVEERGPVRGGILCDLELCQGKWMGAAVVPQTFDERYYKLLLMAPYSEKFDCYLMARLSYPANVAPEFLKEYGDLINGFAEHLSK